MGLCRPPPKCPAATRYLTTTTPTTAHIHKRALGISLICWCCVVFHRFVVDAKVRGKVYICNVAQKDNSKKQNVNEETDTSHQQGTKPSLSEKYAGKLPSEVADELQEHVSRSREEWDTRQ